MLTSYLGGAVMAEKFGTEPPVVVAMHGWGRDRRDWTDVLAGLDATALDLPGFGLSPAPPDAWGAAGYADFLAPLITGLGDVVLVGHSFGGRVAITLSAQLPNVTGVVLTGVPLLRSEAVSRPRTGYRLRRWLHARGVLSDAAMESARRRYGSRDYAQASGVMRDVLVRVVQEEYTEALTATSVPVAMVWGAEDTVVPLAVAERARGLTANATVTAVPRSGHLLDAASSAAVRSQIDLLLAGHDA